MSSHARKKMRKIAQKMQSSASQKPKNKTLTPTALSDRFKHIVKNPQDSMAMVNYAQQLSKALKARFCQYEAQFKRLLDEQINELKTITGTGHTTLYHEHLVKFGQQLERIKRKSS